MALNKGKIGIIFGITSILAAVISVIVFYVSRGPNADVYPKITIFSILSIFGILLALFSWVMSKYKSIGIIGLIANVFVLVCTYLLLLAMSIGEE
ncbi:hypothetical protein [Ureibacillus sp. GCM10028918]|uniref:hypothetical protein n=1 Tax=Ureibacillus sp. GCM10028918 TaxID=3273429 RepID=UPI003608757D